MFTRRTSMGLSWFVMTLIVAAPLVAARGPVVRHAHERGITLPADEGALLAARDGDTTRPLLLRATIDPAGLAPIPRWVRLAGVADDTGAGRDVTLLSLHCLLTV